VTKDEHLYQTLAEYLTSRWNGSQELDGLQPVVLAIADGSRTLRAKIQGGMLEDVVGSTGEVNVQGEIVQKLDTLASDTFVNTLSTCGRVAAIGSEEIAKTVNCRECSLQEADLLKADLTEANLEGAILDEAFIAKASLTRANLRGAELAWVNLVSADLTETDLQQATLFRANLEEAILDRARLYGADLRGANLKGASLKGTDLRAVSIFHVSGLTQAQIDSACVDERTRLPKELTPPPPCTNFSFYPP